jgi:N-acyl-D-aspartate/D-glutamate deacylase
MTKRFDLIIRGGTIADGTTGALSEGDIAITGGRISEVGSIRGVGTEEIDARHKLVTPGFIDMHTHYDGQVIWEERMWQSSSHGLTTAVIGNCGMGFAPCRAPDRQALVDLMEGVEDIPEAVMERGLSWDWETFPQYLDAIDRRPHDIDVAAYLPHAALRVYVMGDRAVAGSRAEAADLQRMTDLTREAVAAGAIGFATSRNLWDADSNGKTICTQGIDESELHALGQGLRQAGSGVIQALLNPQGGAEQMDAEFAMLQRLAKSSGRPLSMSVMQVVNQPERWRQSLALIDGAAKEGLPIKGQVIGRPAGLLFGLDLSYHPFSFHPSYQAIAKLSLDERLAALKQPELRARILAEKPGKPPYPALDYFLRAFEWMFLLGDPPNYEPALSDSIAGRAARAGVSPDEVIYDLLIENNGENVFLLAALNYARGTLDDALIMLRDPNTVLGLGDAGAHYGLVTDFSFPTFMLAFWARDRKGEKLSVSETVHALTRRPAEAMGLFDRGIIESGYRADINVIDHDRLTLGGPRPIYDLPGGGRRLRQDAVGYEATIVAGKPIYRHGVSTGALPGRLVRGEQRDPRP